MTYKGRVQNGAVVLDQAAHLPEGAAVEVSVLGNLRQPGNNDSGNVEPELPPDACDLQLRTGSRRTFPSRPGSRARPSSRCATFSLRLTLIRTPTSDGWC